MYPCIWSIKRRNFRYLQLVQQIHSCVRHSDPGTSTTSFDGGILVSPAQTLRPARGPSSPQGFRTREFLHKRDEGSGSRLVGRACLAVAHVAFCSPASLADHASRYGWRPCRSGLCELGAKATAMGGEAQGASSAKCRIGTPTRDDPTVDCGWMVDCGGVLFLEPVNLEWWSRFALVLISRII